jgi:hypothetical protein
MSASEPRSSFRVAGGFARANPVPTTVQSFLSKAVATCLPSRPVAPVMRAVFAMVVVVRSLGAFRDRGVVDRELCHQPAESLLTRRSARLSYLHSHVHALKAAYYSVATVHEVVSETSR